MESSVKLSVTDLRVLRGAIMTAEPIQIDGSYGEGGGQILRTSVSLAALTGRSVEITRIRAGRSRPGLQAQHLTAVRAVATLCAATLDGDAVGSQGLLFTPRADPQPGRYRFEIGTAGAAPLVVQSILLPLALAAAPSGATVIGGTHVPHAPPFEYLEAVYLPAMRRAGLVAEAESSRAGFFPAGGGEVGIETPASVTLQPLDLTERGRLQSLTAYVITGELPEHVGARGEATIERYLRGVGRRATVEIRRLPAPGPGAAVVLAAECEGGHAGFTGLGRRGKPMEEVAEEPCAAFMAWWKSGAACDEHLADQLVLPMALAAGESRWSTPAVTEHLRTVLWVARRFLPIESRIEESDGGPATVVLRGVEARQPTSTRATP
jgi:RNA 3'-terminal phosphate cyclase (ATP)